MSFLVQFHDETQRLFFTLLYNTTIIFETQGQERRSPTYTYRLTYGLEIGDFSPDFAENDLVA